MEQNKDQSCAAVRSEAVVDGGWNVLYDKNTESDHYVKHSDALAAARRLAQGGRFDVRIVKVGVSARAADAPSEPSELTDDQIREIRAKVLVQCINHNGNRTSDYEQKFARAIEAAVKSRAADALDSQPTAPTINYVRSDWESMCRKAVAVLNKHIVPDGISDHDALNELYGIFDSDEYRATGAIEQDACEARQAVQMGIDRTVAAMAAPKEPHWIDGEQSALGGKTAREGYAANPEYAGLYASSQPTDGGVRNG